MADTSMKFDLIIVGAGPAGLSAAIRYAQLCQTHERPLSVCVLEKGAEVGAHTLSGAVLETRALVELLPDFQAQGAPVNCPVKKDGFYYLTQKHACPLPIPAQTKNHGNHIISLGALCRWLAEVAEGLGVEIYPGFPATTFIKDEQGNVIGVTTGAMGLDKQGQPKPNHQPGMNLYGKQVFLAEGCRGSLTQDAIRSYGLADRACPQTYGIGFKEVWECAHEHTGTVIHTVGWPLNRHTYGGSFIYYPDNMHIALGLVIGLDYKNPRLDLYQEFQRFKTHPFVKARLEGGRCMHYGARALNEGGYQSIPKLVFPGGALIGCAAGFMNVPKIKGTHTAMKSGMLAAESLFSDLDYEQLVQGSWIVPELKRARNIRPAFRFGREAGLIYSAFDMIIFRGKTPWTFRHMADHTQLRAAKHYPAITYPKADGIYTFDKMTSVSRSNTHHEADQPVHLKLIDAKISIDTNYKVYDSPEQRYCPAGVYEIIAVEGQPKLQINAQNCVHCKTCDIKDPRQNIRWVPPEGGGGPHYAEM